MLAEKLGRTVEEMRRTVTNAEWIGWAMYYARKAQARQLADLQAASRMGGAR